MPGVTTIIDAFRRLKIEPEPHLTWFVSDAVHDVYVEIEGELPRRDNRPKTYDHGSHCCEIYPDWMVPVIERTISKHRTVFENWMPWPRMQ